MDIGIQPSATLFRKGETLGLVIQGRDLGEYSPASGIPRAGAGINGDATHSVFLDESYLELPAIANRY